MSLTLEQIREILLTPTSNKLTISEAIKHEERVKFHTQQTINGNYRRRGALNDYLSWVRGLLPADKFTLFLHLFRYPVKTTILSESIFSSFGRVFDSNNKVEQVDFSDPDLKVDWESFNTDFLRKWETEGLEVLKSRVNSVMVIDLSIDQLTERPEPYFYFLDIGSVVDISMNGNDIEWIMFRQSDNRVVALCDKYYRVLEMKEGSSTEVKMLILEEGHDLGSTPAKFFWETPISYEKPVIKKSPITPYLGNFDWSLFFSMSKRHLDTYAPFPILSGFEEDCDYSAENGDTCENGFLKDQNGFYYPNRASGDGDSVLQKCPICSERNSLAGAGSYIEVPVPDESNGNSDLRNPVSITTVPRENLDYVTDESIRLDLEIYQAITGDLGETINTQAINSDQVFSFFESQRQKLMPIKKNFEIAIKWVNESICKMRYGSSFIGYTIDLGNEFYLIDENVLLDIYNDSRKKGLSSVLLDELEDQYNATKYKNNLSKLSRINILNNLDPMRHKTVEDVSHMYEMGQISFEDFYLKTNFSSLVMRFERENMDVLIFGSLLDFNEKIRRIKEILVSYIGEPPIQLNTNKNTSNNGKERFESTGTSEES